MPKKVKCEYCGANVNANCHAHTVGCPYSCNVEQPHNPPTKNLPIGDGMFTLLTFMVIYLFIKRN